MKIFHKMFDKNIWKINKKIIQLFMKIFHKMFENIWKINKK